MRRRLLDNLYVGDLEDCRACTGDDWSVVHACKNPCHAAKFGQQPDRDAPTYLAAREGRHLWLNMIDPSVPMFRTELFLAALEFLRDEWHAGRKILIHCNQGNSRAPSLALLFLAKVLHRLTNDSYDAAWDAFDEMLATDRYQPSKGIETWLRDNWNAIPVFDRLSSLPDLPPEDDGARQVAQRTPMEFDIDSDSALALVREQPLVHFNGFTKIETKEHVWARPEPNALQFDIDEAYDWCMANNLPCRLLILKPRQVGCSTKVGHTCYHHMRRFPSDMIVMGDVAKRTEKVWQIFQDYGKHDDYPWDSVIATSNTEKTRFAYPDGSEGLVEHDTALDPKAGISGTRQVVWLTEAARYMKTNGRDKKVITAVLNSLPNNPKTLGIAESTAEGAAGWFYETWQGAVSLEERKNGVTGNGWIRVFAPWFVFTEHRLDRAPQHAGYFDEGLDARERRGIALYGWTAEQIAWRRMKIANDCGGDPRMFDQDFPEDAESCFLASGRPRFDPDGVTHLERIAKVQHDLAEVGTIERNDRGEVAFLPRTGGEAWLWVGERPQYGCRYIGFVDPCTGEQAEGSPFPDAHACGIVRAGYTDERNVWHNPRLVAAIDVPTGCRWDDELVAERMKRLLDWYGNCMVVPETGNGLGVLNELRRVGCVIYHREKMDAVHPGERLEVIGWETNKSTRPLVVNAIANLIRERGFDCGYLPAVREMRTFIVNDRGKAEAKSGCHDDWVLGIGIALDRIDFADTLLPPRTFESHRSPESGMSVAGLTGRAFS